MAITPGTYNMIIQRRSDHSVDFQLKDSSSANVNLTGYSVASQVWDKTRTNKVADATITITSASGGAFTWKVTDDQTVNFTNIEYNYDILLTNPSGDKEYWLKGVIFMSEGYTA
tara:strand:- start:878 stop:1219 length:342 start_codon:yes stop_codon:yes gene_type:complete